jgi:hypothetical protein
MTPHRSTEGRRPEGGRPRHCSSVPVSPRRPEPPITCSADSPSLVGPRRASLRVRRPASRVLRSFLRGSQNTRNAPKRFLSLRDELFRNAYLHVVVPGLVHDLGHRTRGNDRARSQYDHAVTQLLYLREKMAAQDNARAMIARDTSQEYEQLLLAPWVQSEGRFVQKQEWRLVDERPCDSQSLLHPAAIGRYQGSRPVLKTNLPQEACGALFGFSLSLAIEPAEVREVFGGGYVLGKTMAFGQNAYDLADPFRLVVADTPTIENLPAVGCRMVVRIRMAVVFPAPLGPRNPMILPGLSEKDRPFRAVLLS